MQSHNAEENDAYKLLYNKKYKQAWQNNSQ